MPAFIDTPPALEAVVITQDYGGSVIDYQGSVYKYTKEGRVVKILGDCNSACTLALAVPKVCVGPKAVLRWHQAYTPTSHAIRSDITEEMLHSLPKAVQKRIDGKIQVGYSPEATLYYSDLIELGIPSCDGFEQSTKTVTASVELGIGSPSYDKNPCYPVPADKCKPIPAFNPPSQRSSGEQGSYEDQKINEWVNYTNWAYETSLSQFGKYNKKVYRSGQREQIYLSYWDSNRRYVTAAEYKKNGVTTQRMVCRSASPDAEEMTCTDWMTEAKYNYEYDFFSGEYVRSGS